MSVDFDRVHRFKKYDIIIIGAGVSGLYAALNLDKRFSVLLLSKNELTLCNSALAQGGVAAVMDKENDDFARHIEDTLIAGGYANDLENLKILVENGPENIETLISLGVNFDKNADGSISLTLEGGHSQNRIAHHKDSTGYEIVTSLIERVKLLENVDCYENACVLQLEKKDKNFYIEVFKDNEKHYYAAEICVLATGGIGGIYDFTTNSEVATGDGITFAYETGAEIKDISLIQFHPTAFADRGARECFLISEAARGEGAYLYNCNKERFMERYDERGELAPRDVVSKAIMQEEKKTGSSEFYLDISHKAPEFVKSRFPMIYERLLEKNWDLTKQPVPVYPCQHYLMGGIAVEGATGATTVKGLYASGECARTGVHGLNRLASNSLLEALVFSRLVARDINKNYRPEPNIDIQTDAFKKSGKLKTPETIKQEIRSIMQKSYFIEPNFPEAQKGLERICQIKQNLESGDYEINPEFTEAKSLATIAKLALEAVLTK